MLEGAEKVQEESDVLPAAPVVRGKKLSSKPMEDRLLVSV
jgi:hypothetical protein